MVASLRLWQTLTPMDVLSSDSRAVDQWLDFTGNLTIAANRRSAAAAASYYSEVRGLSLPGAAAYEPELVDPPPLEAVRTSLFVTGVVGARKRIEQVPQTQPGAPAGVDGLRSLLDRQKDLMAAAYPARVDEAMALSGEAAAAAVVRHTANGARDQVRVETERDTKATGYVRVTTGKPCFFCAALASRGAVYKGDSFDESDARFEGPGTAKVHDSCGCVLRPTYSRSPEEIPELNRALQKRWEDENSGGTMLEWRRLYENRAVAE